MAVRSQAHSIAPPTAVFVAFAAIWMRKRDITDNIHDRPTDILHLRYTKWRGRYLEPANQVPVDVAGHLDWTGGIK